MSTDCDIIGGFPTVDPNCKGCGKPLTIENAWMTDGCPCNTPLGINSMNETRWRLLMRLQQQQARRLEAGNDLQKRYQLETLRTSDLGVLLRRAAAFLKDRFHCPTVASQEADCCRLVRDIDTLLERSINDAQALREIGATA